MYHPDTSHFPDAHDRMQALNEAYAVLSNPNRRAAYDAAWERFHQAPVAPAPPPVNHREPEPIQDDDTDRIAFWAKMAIRLVAVAFIHFYCNGDRSPEVSSYHYTPTYTPAQTTPESDVSPLFSDTIPTPLTP